MTRQKLSWEGDHMESLCWDNPLHLEMWKHSSSGWATLCHCGTPTHGPAVQSRRDSSSLGQHFNYCCLLTKSGLFQVERNSPSRYAKVGVLLLAWQNPSEPSSCPTVSICTLWAHLGVWTVQEAQACRVGSIIASVFSISFPALTESQSLCSVCRQVQGIPHANWKNLSCQWSLGTKPRGPPNPAARVCSQTLRTRRHLLASFTPPASSHPNPFYSVSETLQVRERCLRTGSMA